MEMRRFILLILLVLGPGLAAPAREGGPLLRFIDAEQSVDTVRFDAGVRMLHYRFENLSDKPVTILEVHSTCGCFTGKAAATVLAPGAASELIATLDPKSLHGDQRRHLTVVSTDGEATLLNSVTVTGFVLRDESEGEIRFAEHLGQGLRTDTVGNTLLRDSFGDYVFTIPLYNDTDDTVRILCVGSWRMRLRYPAEIPPRSRVDLRGTCRPGWPKRDAVEEILHIVVNGTPVTPVFVRGTIL